MPATRTAIAVSAIACLAIGTSEAQFIGLDITPNQPSGGVVFSNGDHGPGGIDLVDDLHLENPGHSSMALILEHPIRALPNIKYRGYSLNSNDISNFASGMRFNGESLHDSDDISTSVDITHDDIVLYYRLLDSRIGLDMGLDLKRFEGEVLLNGATDASVDVEETIPLLYLSARYDLPNSGFYLGADINANFVDLGFTDSSALDSTIKLGYDSGSGLGVEGGFKHFSLELDDVNNFDTDLEHDGIYLNGYFNF